MDLTLADLVAVGNDMDLSLAMEIVQGIASMYPLRQIEEEAIQTVLTTLMEREERR